MKRIIKHQALIDFYIKYADAKGPLEAWYTKMRGCQATNLAELRQTFNSVDVVGRVTVFNIKGNNYRLITGIHYNRQIVYILEVLTHAEYSKDEWKKRFDIHP